MELVKVFAVSSSSSPSYNQPNINNQNTIRSFKRTLFNINNKRWHPIVTVNHSTKTKSTHSMQYNMKQSIRIASIQYKQVINRCILAIVYYTLLISPFIHPTRAQVDNHQYQEWNVINRIPSNLIISGTQAPQLPFPRPPPRTLDPSILTDFSDSFNLLQDISSTGDDTMFTDVSMQYVAAIPNAFVEGESGLIYDSNSNVYHLDYFFNNRTNPVLPIPHRTVASASQQCQQRNHRYPQLASIIQRYGHMYYHFLVEALPRVVMLQRAGVLTSSTKLLTWGQPYEAAWYAALGIRADQLVVFDPETVYCADTLYLPTPIPRITPPKEALMLLRDTLGIRDLQPPSERNTIVYVSRASEPTRRVSNEQSILTMIARAYPSSSLVVFNGADMTPQQTIDLFQKAKVVIGPHGAGLSHLLFAAPGTAIIEFLFMTDPPLMFWHCASALNQQYWMLPVPQSYYMQRDMVVPEGEVMDIMATVMSTERLNTGGKRVCQGGTAGALCTQCPPGSYSYMNTGTGGACKLCAAGRIASTPGSTACKTCKAGTYSNMDGTACIACPKGTYSTLAGSSSINQCLGQEQRRRRLEEQVLSVEMLSKLSPTFEKQLKRRALIQGIDRVTTMTQQELCSASAAIGAFAGPYAMGPYGGSGGLVCPSPVSPSPPVYSPSPSPSPQNQNQNNNQQQPVYALPPTPPPYGTPIITLPPININNTISPPLPPLIPNPALPPSPPPDFDEKGDPIVQPPSQAPAPQPEQPPPQGKHVLDTWAIALIATASALVAIPLLVCCGMWCVARRRRTRQARAAASLKHPQQFATTNPAFNAPLSTPSGSSAGGSSHGGRDLRHEA